MPSLNRLLTGPCDHRDSDRTPRSCISHGPPCSQRSQYGRNYKSNNIISAASHQVDDPTLKEVLARLKDSSQFELRKRHVEDFNKRNLWRKRGIALVPLRYPHNQFGTR